MTLVKHKMIRRILNLSQRTALRFFLTYTAFGWGICLAGVFTPAATAFDLLEYIGGIDPAPMLADPMYDYWLRMASSTFAFIGIGYLILAIWPRRFSSVLPFAGAFMLLEGVILLVHGLRLDLQPTPFLGDTAFCLVGGIGILLFMGSVREEE
ncbi:MAG: hypothetical protein ISR85_03715 [Kiritimatiellales bacterium]|nr:hypothetical protein [Kiritimatiellales bacterium]